MNPGTEWQAKCAAVIPCLNEAGTIGTLVRELRQQIPTVLVVDDGSTDGTARLAELAGASVIQHQRTCGKGVALRTGWTEARSRGFTWALTLDGDGQHSPEDVPAFLECAEHSNVSLIVGDRMNHPDHMPWVRRAANLWMSRRLSSIAGRALPDSQCGFRLLKLSAWSALPIQAEHFEIESELLLRFVRAGYRIEFVPIQVIYRYEQSRIHPLLDTIRWLRWWIRFRRETSGARQAVGSKPVVSSGARGARA